MDADARTVLVTGSRKGIGRAIAEHYLEKGMRVIGCSRGDSDLAHPYYRHFQVDISSEEDVKSMFATIRKEGGNLDALINNAGIASMNHVILTPGSTVSRIMGTNFFGTFIASREAVKLMKKQRSGRIVNLATVATPLKLEGEAAYAASKAAVVSLTEIMAREVAPFNITVNAVGPTPIATDLIRSVSEEKIQALIDRQAVKRLGEHRDVINVIDFFMRPESDFVTGQTLYLGGI